MIPEQIERELNTSLDQSYRAVHLFNAGRIFERTGTIPQGFSSTIHFNCETHEEVLDLIQKIGGKFNRSLDDYYGKLQYTQNFDGTSIYITLKGEHPACKIIEEEVEVPEQVVAAHTKKVRRLECAPAPSEAESTNPNEQEAPNASV